MRSTWCGMLVRVCAGERKGVERSARPTRWRVEVRAPRESRADRIAQEQTRLSNQLRGCSPPGDAGCPAIASPLVDRGTRLGGAPLPLEVQTRLARAEARWAVLERQLTELEAQQQAAVPAAAPASALRQLVQLKGVATTSASVLLDEAWCGGGSAIGARSAGSWALRRPRSTAGVGAGARDQSGGQRAPAIDQHSAGVELGALATAERADAVVSSAIRHRETRASAGDCGGRA
jgi:hypothetical protein